MIYSISWLIYLNLTDSFGAYVSGMLYYEKRLVTAMHSELLMGVDILCFSDGTIYGFTQRVSFRGDGVLNLLPLPPPEFGLSRILTKGKH